MSLLVEAAATACRRCMPHGVGCCVWVATHMHQRLHESQLIAAVPSRRVALTRRFLTTHASVLRRPVGLLQRSSVIMHAASCCLVCAALFGRNQQTAVFVVVGACNSMCASAVRTCPAVLKLWAPACAATK
jgi:hypothetical protein